MAKREAVKRGDVRIARGREAQRDSDARLHFIRRLLGEGQC
jgi:hypothetical protein